MGGNSTAPTTTSQTLSQHPEYNPPQAMLTATIGSRAFSTGFEIRTDAGIFKTEDVSPAPFSSETHLLDPSGNQIARMSAESLLSDVSNIIITGGGLYQFAPDPASTRRWSRENWTCTGEGRILLISQKNRRLFIISENEGEIATCSKTGYLDDYTLTIQNDSDLKLLICIAVLMARSAQSSDIAASLL